MLPLFDRAIAIMSGGASQTGGPGVIPGWEYRGRFEGGEEVKARSLYSFNRLNCEAHESRPFEWFWRPSMWGYRPVTFVQLLITINSFE
jgi:hypothetical protein